MLHGENPKIRLDNAINQSEPGVLSVVETLPMSKEPKKKAFQFCVIDQTAAE